jgi:urease accessory protein
LTAPLDAPALLRLLQLASPALPVGAYAYSQGLEWAVEAGWVTDEATLGRWLDEQLTESFGRVDLPILSRLHRAAREGDDAELRRWSRELVARRETRELVADDRDRGRALARLLRDLGVGAAALWADRDDAPFAALAALAATAWNVPLEPALHAHAFGWLENQVLAGVKLIPLGQVAGQRLLLTLTPRIPAVVAAALALDDDDIGGTLPILAIASSLHETQYTRLFRS